MGFSASSMGWNQPYGVNWCSATAPARLLPAGPGGPPLVAAVEHLLLGRALHQLVGPGPDGPALLRVVEGEGERVLVLPDMLGQDVLGHAMVTAQRGSPPARVGLV